MTAAGGIKAAAGRQTLARLLAVLDQNPDDSDAQFDMALALRDLGHEQPARALLTRLAHSSDCPPRVWAELAPLLAAEGHTAAADTLARRAGSRAIAPPRVGASLIPPSAAVIKVGLAWADNGHHVPLADLLTLTRHPLAAVYALQDGDRAADSRRLAHPSLLLERPEGMDIADAVAEMDMLVCVPGAARRVAEDLGIPVWPAEDWALADHDLERRIGHLFAQAWLHRLIGGNPGLERVIAIGTGALDPTLPVLAIEARTTRADALRHAGLDTVTAVAGDGIGRALAPASDGPIIALPAWSNGGLATTALDTLLADLPGRAVIWADVPAWTPAILAGLRQSLASGTVATLLLPAHSDLSPLDGLGFRVIHPVAGLVIALAAGIEAPADDVTQADRLAEHAADSDPVAAAQLFATALEHDPFHVAANAALGVLARAEGRVAAAAVFARRALTTADHPALWSNLGNALTDLGRWDEADDAHRRALTAAPDDAALLGNAARLARLRGDADRERALLERMIPCPDAPPGGEALLADALMKSGEWAEGLRRRPLRGSWRGIGDGEGLAGHRVRIRADGDGRDTVMLIRYAARLAGMGAQVTLDCPASAARLMATATGVHRVAGTFDDDSEIDIETVLSDLPRLLGPDIPVCVPYLTAETDLFATGSGLRIGLAWGGSPGERPLPLSHLQRLAADPTVQLLALGTDRRVRDLELTGASAFIAVAGGEGDDLAERARIIASLDVLIAGDTVEAHIAGALGKPVWVAVPLAADWRWPKDGPSPWYPTATLFRQSPDGSWDAAINHMAKAVKEWGISHITG